MKLIDRYVTEVGRRLPLLRGRKDIEDELRSTLEDMLEDRAQKAGRPADESMEAELLREYGAPDKVAATYNSIPYLIGPRIFPFYIWVGKIVLSVLVVVLLVLLGVQLATHPPATGLEFFSALGAGLSGLISALISAFGMMTLVFAIIERLAPASEFKLDADNEWDPASLMKEPEPDDVKMWEPILGIIFTAIVLSILNFNPDLVGIHVFSDGKWISIPVLTQAFFRWLPLINIALLAEIFVQALLLRTGRWTLSTRLISMGINILQMLIGYFMLTGPSILAITPESLQSSGIFDAESARILGMMAQQGVRGLIALLIFLQGVDLVKKALKLFRQKTLVLA